MDLESPANSDVDNSIKKRRRIPRACDRCRLKKSKCDGARACKACKATGSTCLYRTRRNREAKNYYWYMRDITEGAVIRLYWAARNGTGFPGQPVEAKDGRVSVHAILEGLGLTGPIEDDAASKDLLGNSSRPTYPLQALRRESPTPSLTPDESTTSTSMNVPPFWTDAMSKAEDSKKSNSTRLQRQFLKQIQVPAKISPNLMPSQFEAVLPQDDPQRSDMSAKPQPYIPFRHPGPARNTIPIQPDLYRFEPQLAPRPAHDPGSDNGEGLMASQFFDFETAGVTPGWNVDDFDFTFQHGYPK